MNSWIVRSHDEEPGEGRKFEAEDPEAAAEAFMERITTHGDLSEWIANSNEVELFVRLETDAPELEQVVRVTVDWDPTFTAHLREVPTAAERERLEPRRKVEYSIAELEAQFEPDPTDSLFWVRKEPPPVPEDPPARVFYEGPAVMNPERDVIASLASKPAEACTTMVDDLIHSGERCSLAPGHTGDHVFPELERALAPRIAERVRAFIAAKLTAGTWAGDAATVVRHLDLSPLLEELSK